MATIKLKNGSGAPLASDLVQGEPALDLTNKRLYTEDAGGAIIEVGTNPSSITTSSADIDGGSIDGTVIGGVTPAAVTTTALVATTADIDAGTIDGTVIGGVTPAAVTTTSLVATTADINGGSIDGTTIGGTTPAAGSFTTGSFTGDVSFGDNDKAIFGAGSDLQVYHDGSDSYIDDTGTGRLRIRGAADIVLAHPTNGETYATFSANGANTFYYDGSAKLATTATGIDVTGVITTDGMTTSADINFGDNDKAIFGAGSDLQIYHDGSNSYIDEAGTGTLRIRGYNQVRVTDTSDNIAAIFKGDAESTLYHNNAAKLATTATGIDVTGTVTAGGLDVDNIKIESGLTASPTNDGANYIFRSSSEHVDYLGGDLIIQARSSASRDIYMVTGSPTPVNRLQVNGNGNIGFYEATGTNEKFFWDASAESLGIGTTLNSGGLYSGLNVRKDTTGVVDSLTLMNSQTTGAAAQGVRINMSGVGEGDTDLRYAYIESATESTSNNHYIAFGTNAAFAGPTEAMRIDSSGNLLVGTTTNSSNVAGVTLGNSGLITGCRSSNYSAIFNRLSTDGDIAKFRKNGVNVFSIGTSSGSYPYLVGGAAGATQAGIRFINDQSIRPCTSSGSNLDNTLDLGVGAARWDDIYATNGTIQTSDRNEKQDIEELSDAEQRVAVAAKGLLRKFRWIDSVEEKGDDARIHFGIMAQDLEAAFAAEGLDAGRYAMFISNTWWESTEIIPAVEAQEAVVDEEGNVVEEAVEAQEERTVVNTHDTAEEAPEGSVERTRLGVRYPELLAFIIAAI